MLKTTIYKLLLTMFLLTSPCMLLAQKSNDINKPTRERVKNDKDKNKDKNSNKKSQTSSNADQKASTSKANADQKANNTKTTTTTDKKSNNNNSKTTPDPKANDSKTAPAKDNKKGENAPAVTEPKTPAKPAADTTSKKPTEPKKKKTRQPVNTDKVQFDGIDISAHQGYINWAELKNNRNIKYIYIKATEGSSFTDPRYKEYIREARKHGFKVGSYHFFRTTSSAQSQFLNFVKTVNREEQDLLPMLDIEVKKNCTPQQLRDSVMVFLDLVEQYYGCKALIYTGERFFNDYLGLAFKNYPLFIAKYSSYSPKIPQKWVLWQFSESGYFSAVKSNYVDLSRFNEGCSIKDIAYVPSKHTPKKSVLDLVNHKPAPTNVTMTEEKKPVSPEQQKKDAAKQKAQEERAKKDAEKKAAEKRAADKKAADKKAAEKKAADKKAAEKKAADKKAADKKAAEKRTAERAAERRAAEKAEQDAKAKRKAEAQKAREQKKANQNTGKTSKSSSLFQGSASQLTQSQRNDSIRNANLKGRKTNKSSADND